MTYPDELAKERHALWKRRFTVGFASDDVTEIMAYAFAKTVVDMERELDQLRHEVTVIRMAEEEIVRDLGIKAPDKDSRPIHGLIDAYKAK